METTSKKDQNQKHDHAKKETVLNRDKGTKSYPMPKGSSWTKEPHWFPGGDGGGCYVADGDTP